MEAAADAGSGEVFVGKVVRDNGKFGFLQSEDGTDLFVMPAACAAFGGRIPRLGTKVCCEIVSDAKTGRPRAENVQPMEGEPDPADLFAAQLAEFEAETRKQAGAGDFGSDVDISALLGAEAGEGGADAASGRRFGTIARNNGTFGFIDQEGGETENMFVIPGACQAFGTMIPPVGTRISFQVVTDEKTGRPRADNVLPVGGAGPIRGRPGATARSDPYSVWGKGAAAAPGGDRASGTVVSDGRKFGFIQQDAGGDNMFLLPGSCEGFGGELPPNGTRVTYSTTTDSKTGRIRAESVFPEDGSASLALWTAAPNGYGGKKGKGKGTALRMPGSRLSGTVVSLTAGKYGFIEQDNGGENMFIIPSSCQAIGLQIPPVGTRVTFEVVVDEKTGRPRADGVLVDSGVGGGKGKSKGAWNGGGDDWDTAALYQMLNEALYPGASASSPGKASAKGKGGGKGGKGVRSTGTVAQASAKFGFIQQDVGGDNMFVLPFSFPDHVIPPEGTRVSYTIVADQKTGRPRAEDVLPEGFDRAGIEYAGTVIKHAPSGSYGFIQQDTGGDNMMLLPSACESLGGALPAIGTRVVYTVTTDMKTGRPRAEEVREEGGPAAMPGQGMVPGAKGNGRAMAALPY